VATQSDTKEDAFEILGLIEGFFKDASRRGLTTNALRKLCASPRFMNEFVALAKKAEQECAAEVALRELEKERAVIIDEKHYRLVLIPLWQLCNWNCTSEDFVSTAVLYERNNGFLPLQEEAYGNAEMVIRTVRACGPWLAWTSAGEIVVWERTAEGIESRGSYGVGEGICFKQFENCLGMVFMQECPDCDHLASEVIWR